MPPKSGHGTATGLPKITVLRGAGAIHAEEAQIRAGYDPVVTPSYWGQTVVRDIRAL